MTLTDTETAHQTILAVDLGIHSVATVSVMRSDGTMLGRYFCKLPKEYDSLNHALNRIKKAHRMGMRISRICAWGTSKQAFDGSGKVLRGKETELGSYSLCRFINGKYITVIYQLLII